jgi:hypothetical protein
MYSMHRFNLDNWLHHKVRNNQRLMRLRGVKTEHAVKVIHVRMNCPVRRNKALQMMITLTVYYRDIPKGTPSNASFLQYPRRSKNDSFLLSAAQKFANLVHLEAFSAHHIWPTFGNTRVVTKTRNGIATSRWLHHSGYRCSYPHGQTNRETPYACEITSQVKLIV